MQLKMADGIERGTVRNFLPGKGKNYGFIKQKNMPDLHFHFDRGTLWQCTNDVFGFLDRMHYSPSRRPCEDDDIYYIKYSNGWKPTASIWALGTDLDIFLGAEKHRRTVLHEIWDDMTPQDLAEQLDMKVKDILRILLNQRLMMTINSNMPLDLSRQIAESLRIPVTVRLMIPNDSQLPASK